LDNNSSAPAVPSSSDSAFESNEEEDSVSSNNKLADVPVLRDVSLETKAGDQIAIVGHVGAGKSTLLSGILGDALDAGSNRGMLRLWDRAENPVPTSLSHVCLSVRDVRLRRTSL
jgi:predicted ABC-type transport system involved in lysophospholipase L1 biosynthesis ATPase subunit